MEILVQCVEDLICEEMPDELIEQSPEWQAIATLLKANPWLHAGTIHYWSLFDEETEPCDCFRVTGPMRRLWAEVRHAFD
jgi:hypothetical protein